MTTLDEVAALMAALGPHDDEIETITRNSEKEWSVAFDEDTIIMLTFVTDQQKLVLASTLATPPTEQRLATYQALLSYNLLWEETGGVTMALGGEHGAVVQLFELNTAELDLARLDNVLVNFAEKARTWREVIHSGSLAEPGFRAEDQREFMLRV